jgi:DNA-binding transcriptional regulator GbsR (MarR family)
MWKHLLDTTTEAQKALQRWRAAVQRKFTIKCQIEQYSVVPGVKESKEQLEMMQKESQDVLDLVSELNEVLMKQIELFQSQHAA